MQKAFENRLFFWQGFEPALSHIIYAASDMFLMPSTYEPCGLTQIISMQYGAVPVVRFTGGLVDTIVNEAAEPAGCGFGFIEPESDRYATADIPLAAEYLFVTVKRAMDVFDSNPDRWAELVKTGMAKDSSWEIPARQYVKIYHEAVRRRITTHFLSK